MGMSGRLLRPRQSGFNPRSISGLAMWLDAADSQTLYTTDAGPVTAVSAPTEISGCVGWWDASDATSITKDGSNLVSQWNDKSGNARHATASGSLRPTSGGLQNGRTVMQFTGTQAMSITGNFLQSDNVTMFAVAMKNTDHYGGIISSAPANPEDSPLLGFYSTTLAFVNRRQVVQQAVSNGVYRIIAAQSVGTTQQGWFDGVKTTDSVASVATNTSNTITKIGAFRTSSTADLNGNIAEIVCYSGNLSTADRARVEAYLAAKWGISGVHAPATATSDPVGAWRNKASAGGAFTQSTSTMRPTLTGGYQNGKPAIVSDGVDDWLSASPASIGVASAAAATGVFVTKRTAAGSAAGWDFGTNLSGQQSAGSGLVYDDFFRSARTPGTFSGQSVSVTSITSPGSGGRGWRINGAQMSFVDSGAFAVPATAYVLGGPTFPSGFTSFGGGMCEALIYTRVLSEAEIAALERYLASKWAITLAPQVANADAQDWVNRVYANGGTVSATTAAAVNTFCESIDTAGLRSKMVRVNLMCGSNLNAVLVPLYRATSSTGTQLGNATDTNDNFTNDHYAENSGLIGNASNRRLNTGLNRSTLGVTVHGGCFVASRATGVFRAYFGVENQATAFDRFFMDTGSLATLVRFSNNGPAATGETVGQTHAAGDFIVGTVTSTGANFCRIHINGNFLVSASGVDATSITHPIHIFAQFRGSTSSFTGHSDARIGGYTLGSSLSDAEVTTYSTIWDTFLKALGRR